MFICVINYNNISLFVSGCVYKGTVHASDTEWRDPADPCRILRCEAGVVTESTMHCYTPCENIRPPAPGQCCPSCQGKTLKNRNIRYVNDDEMYRVTNDPEIVFFFFYYFLTHDKIIMEK